jgi:hypothetical protein
MSANALRVPFLRPERGARFHKCPVRGCAATIKVTLAMCHSHWNLVPGPLRAAVLAQYRSAPQSAGHLAAIEAACGAVEAMSLHLPQGRVAVLQPALDDSAAGQIERRVREWSAAFTLERDARVRGRLADVLEAGRHLAADLRAAKAARLVAEHR